MKNIKLDATNTWLNKISVLRLAKLFTDGSRGQCRCGWRMMFYLNLTVDKQLLHSFSVSLMQTCMMHTNPKGQCQL